MMKASTIANGRLGTTAGTEVGFVPLQVQVCGRQETVKITRVAIAEVEAVVERHFEVRPPFMLMSSSGKHLQDDEALAACVATNGVVVVRLTEGVLHDLSRRVDQLRHLQWGYFIDQMASAKQQRVSEADDWKKLRFSMEQDLLRREKSSRDEGMRALSDRIAEIQHGVQLGFEARDTEAAVLGKRVEELSQALRDRDHDCEGLKSEMLDLRQQIGELRQALAAERRDRANVAIEAREAATEIQKAVQQEAGDRQSETQELMSLVQELEATLSSSLLEVRQNISEVSKRASTTSETQVRDIQKMVMDVQKAVDSDRASRHDAVDHGFQELRHELKYMQDSQGKAMESVRSEIEIITNRAVDELDTEFKKDLREYAEAIAKLRVDCKEAMHREVKSRHENDVLLQEAIEQESKARIDAVNTLDRIISDMRHPGSSGGAVRWTAQNHMQPLLSGGSAIHQQLSQRTMSEPVASEVPTSRAGTV